MTRRCRTCDRPLRAPSPDGYGPVCRRKERPAAWPGHTQPALEDTMTDFRFTVDLPSGPAEASITLPGSEHTVPDERGCPTAAAAHPDATGGA